MRFTWFQDLEIAQDLEAPNDQFHGERLTAPSERLQGRLDLVVLVVLVVLVDLVPVPERSFFDKKLGKDMKKSWKGWDFLENPMGV